MAVVAAAPAMLCYVTRPDAVLMEVEVEAKANGEDCLNQVRATIGNGIPACLWEALGPQGCASGAGQRCSSGPWSAPRTPGSSLLAGVGVGWGRRGRARWGIPGLGTWTLPGAATLPPTLALLSKEGGPAHLPQVCA